MLAFLFLSFIADNIFHLDVHMRVIQCLFSVSSCRGGALQISITIIIIKRNYQLPLAEVSPCLSAVVAQLPDVQPAFSSVHDVLKKEIS